MSNYRLSLRQRWWKTKGTSWPSCWWTWWRGRSRERKIFRFDFLSFFQSFAECCLTEDDGGDGDDTGGGARELLVDPISEAPRQQTQGAWGGRRQDGRQGETLITTMAATITFSRWNNFLWIVVQRSLCLSLPRRRWKMQSVPSGLHFKKLSPLSKKIIFNCRSIFCLQVTFKEVAFLSEVDLKQVSLSFQLAHNLDQPCPDGDLKRVPEKTSSLRDRWSCSTRGLGEDQLRGRCR